MRHLLEGLVVEPESSDAVKVHDHWSHAHLFKTKRVRQLLHLTVLCEDTAPVEIVPVTESTL